MSDKTLKQLGLTEDYNEWVQYIKNITLYTQDKVITDLEEIKNIKLFMVGPAALYGESTLEAYSKKIAANDDLLKASIKQFAVLYAVIFRGSVQGTDDDGNLIDVWSPAQYVIRGVLKETFEEIELANKIIKAGNLDNNECTSIKEYAPDKEDRAKVCEILKALKEVSQYKLTSYVCKDTFKPIKAIEFKDFNSDVCYASFPAEVGLNDLALEINKIHSEEEFYRCMSLLTFKQWDCLLKQTKSII